MILEKAFGNKWWDYSDLPFNIQGYVCLKFSVFWGGDTLWVIARKYGCTVTEIVALNGELITDPDLIFAGWELKIPQD